MAAGTTGALLGLLGTGGGIASTAINNAAIEQINRENAQNERQMTYLQHGLNEVSAENAMQRTIQLYNMFESPEAQKKLLEKAGLSVGLMYGQGGSGGNLTSGAQAQAATPPNYGRFTPNPIMDAHTASILAETAKKAAETENIKEDTKKKEAEAASTWKDLDVKSKQMIVMENQIDEIKQNIIESQQKVDNMLEEKLNIIQKRGNLKATEELTKAQKDYQEALTSLTNIQIEWEPQKQKAQLDNIKALTSQYRAAAKKMMAEADLTTEQKNLLTRQADDLCKKVAMEALMAEYEQKNIQPEEFKKLKEEINAIQLNSWGENQRKHFYEQFNRSGEGSGDFLRILFEDLLPF